MITMPTPQEMLAAKQKRIQATATVIVVTTTHERAEKPESNVELFEEAARKALTDAATEGLELVSFDRVTSYIFTKDGDIMYRHAWQFAAPIPTP